MINQTAVPEITPADASAPTDGEVLLDVREVDEWAAGHAPGSVNLPLSRFHPDRLPEAARLLCVCRSGARSGRAVAALRNAGYDAVNVSGGMNAWQADGLPIERADGRPGTVI